MKSLRPIFLSITVAGTLCAHSSSLCDFTADISSASQRVVKEFEAAEKYISRIAHNLQSPRYAMNVWEEEDNIVVTLDAPGTEPENIDISLTDGRYLTIAGKHEQKKVEDDKYLYREITQSAFKRTVTLPARVKEEDIKAESKNGVLTIILPKEAQQTRTRKIEIKRK